LLLIYLIKKNFFFKKKSDSTNNYLVIITIIRKKQFKNIFPFIFRVYICIYFINIYTIKYLNNIKKIVIIIIKEKV